MTRVMVGIKVYCSNDRCYTFLVSKERRYVGDDGGLGGKWQCAKCNKWTERAPTT